MRKKRGEPLEARICVNPTCRLDFVPDRQTQVFHSPTCRREYWREAVHYAPHACPLCTVVHSPDDAAILDALEMLMRTESFDSDTTPNSPLLLANAVDGFIARRRAILATKPAAPA